MYAGMYVCMYVFGRGRYRDNVSVNGITTGMVLGQGDEEAGAGSLDPVEAERIRLLELDQVTKVRNLCVVLYVCMKVCIVCVYV